MKRECGLAYVTFEKFHKARSRYLFLTSMSLKIFWLLFAPSHAEDHFPVSFGTVIQLRNIGTSLLLASGPRNPALPTSAYEFFGTFAPFDGNWYWTINRTHAAHSHVHAVPCGSPVHLIPADHATHLGAVSFLTVFGLAGIADAAAQDGVWNVSCDGDVWGSKSAVQFWNVGRNCFLAANLNRNAAATAGMRYRLECSPASGINSLWVVDAGLFCLDDLSDRTVGAEAIAV
jgi:hypothetical protein